MDYLKVSSKSSPASVAGAIAGLIKDGLPVEIQSVGAGAVNQAIKAIAIARGFLIPSGVDVLCTPTFQDIEIDGESRTAIRISVFPHTLAPAQYEVDSTHHFYGNTSVHDLNDSYIPYDGSQSGAIDQPSPSTATSPLAEA